MATRTSTQWLIDRDEGIYQFRAWVVPVAESPGEVIVAASSKREMFSIDIQDGSGVNSTRLFKLISSLKSEPIRADNQIAITSEAERLCRQLEEPLLSHGQSPIEDDHHQQAREGMQLSLDL